MFSIRGCKLRIFRFTENCFRMTGLILQEFKVIAKLICISKLTLFFHTKAILLHYLLKLLQKYSIYRFIDVLVFKEYVGLKGNRSIFIKCISKACIVSTEPCKHSCLLNRTFYVLDDILCASYTCSS